MAATQAFQETWIRAAWEYSQGSSSSSDHGEANQGFKHPPETTCGRTPPAGILWHTAINSQQRKNWKLSKLPGDWGGSQNPEFTAQLLYSPLSAVCSCLSWLAPQPHPACSVTIHADPKSKWIPFHKRFPTMTPMEMLSLKMCFRENYGILKT